MSRLDYVGFVTSKLQKVAALVWVLLLLCLSHCAGTVAPRAQLTPGQPHQRAEARPSSPARAEPEAAEPATKKSETRGLFYRTTSPTAVVYLLGSIHVGTQQLYPMRDAIEEAFSEADLAVVEVRLDDASAQTLAGPLLQAMAYPPGESLDEHLTEETRSALSDYVAEANLPKKMFERLRPWAAAVLVTTLELGKLGLSASEGMDHYFQQRAGEAHKKIRALETPEEQLGLLSGIEARVQDLMLRESLERRGELEETMDAALSAWKRGDAQALVDSMLAPMRVPDYLPVFERLFLERNRRMATVILNLLEGKETAFVVVGSGHVVGRGGIVDLLRRAGYTVEQL
jgi:uncharacterized protein YbaP (TraB family)